MAKLLDSREEMGKLDPDKGLASIEEIGSQVRQVWEDLQDFSIPDDYKHFRNVVVAGMGGSAYGTHVIQALFKDELTVPVISVPDYELPAWVDEDTLVLLSSYSGTTEETLSAGRDALKKKAKIIGLTSGGELEKFLKEHNCPAYVFDPKFNYCKQPRYAVGYSIFGQMVLLSKVGILKVDVKDYQDVLNVIADGQLRLSAGVATDENHAKLLAFDVVGRVPVIVVSEHLEGAGHVTANFFNETAKTYSEYRVVPELNHHLMEGLAYPNSNEKDLLFLLVKSKLYSKPNQRRMELTEQVIEKNNCEFRNISLNSKTKIGQVFEWMLFGIYTDFYLAMLNNQNPVAIPWVNWFKSQLKK